MDGVQWRLLNVGTLSQNRLWGEKEKRRIPYCTMTVLQAGGVVILVDPTRPPAEMPRYLDDACGLSPKQVDIVFLTHFHADHHRGLEAFPNAIWMMSEDEIAYWWERTADGSKEQAVLNRLENAPERLAPGVELFPTPGHTPHHASLLAQAGHRKVLVAGDAVLTRAHCLARVPYADREHVEQARRSIERAIQAADILVPGHDNYFYTADLNEPEAGKG